ncbi:DUF2321 domain-containing protein [Paucilactobacillus sp. N302-9]
MGIQLKQLICLNGHQASVMKPMNANIDGFCEICGEKLISKCQQCDFPIFGYHRIDGVWEVSIHVPVPKYCKNCGKPYPWTETEIKSTQEIINLSELSDEDKSDFNNTIPDLLIDSPKTKLAAIKFKIYSAKAGKFVAEALKDIMIELASEAALKELHIK